LVTELPRQHGLDAMRALVVVGLIFFHSALIFDTRDDYYVKNAQTADLSPVAALGVVWAMPLLFLTAGLGVWYSLRRRTVGAFVTERLRRLLVPLVFGVLVLMPIPVWLRLRTEPAYDDSYLHFYPRFLQVRLVWSDFPFVVQDAPPDGGFETGQLWFIVLLLVFSLMLLPVFGWLRGGRGGAAVRVLAGIAERPGAVLLPAVPVALVSAAFEMEEPHAAWSRWAYLLFFLYGFILAGDPRFLASMRRHAPAAGALGLASLAAALAVLRANPDADPFVDYDPKSVVGRFLFGAAGWLWLVAIIGLLARLPSGRGMAGGSHRSSRAGVYLSEAVLPVYVLHQPVLVAVAFFVVDWPIPAVAKYLLISTATLLAVLAAYDLLIRRTAPTRFLFGMRPARAQTVPSPPPGRADALST
jgi:peptidoglycan/LPS O-acetylase OafA/YrhL